MAKFLKTEMVNLMCPFVWAILLRYVVKLWMLLWECCGVRLRYYIGGLWLIQSAEGLNTTKDQHPPSKKEFWADASGRDLQPQHFLDLQPEAPTCRFWTCQSPQSHEPILSNKPLLTCIHTPYWFCFPGEPWRMPNHTMCWQECGAVGLLIHNWWRCKIVPTLWKAVCKFPKKWNIYLP